MCSLLLAVGVGTGAGVVVILAGGVLAQAVLGAHLVPRELSRRRGAEDDVDVVDVDCAAKSNRRSRDAFPAYLGTVFTLYLFSELGYRVLNAIFFNYESLFTAVALAMLSGITMVGGKHRPSPRLSSCSASPNSWCAPISARCST